MSDETERHLQARVDHLEKRREDERKEQHIIIGIAIGIGIFVLFGFGFIGALLGIAAAVGYMIAKGAFF